MNIIPTNNYLFSRDGQQYGPYDGDYLLVLAKNRQLVPSDHVWTDGMSEWLPAIQFDELRAIYAPASASPASSPQVGAAPAMGSPRPAVKQPMTAAPASALGAGPVAGRAPLTAQPGASRPQAARPAQGAGVARNLPGAKFGLILTLFLVTVASFVGALILGGAQIMALAAIELEESQPAEIPSGTAAGFGIAGILYLVGMIASIALSIFTLVYLFRAWKYIQDLPGVIATPGKAIGFLFIPFFNLYWMFQAYWGWSNEYNRRKEIANDGGPEVSSGLFMAYCVLMFFMGLAVFLYLPVMSKICKAINHLSTSPELNA